MLLAPQAPFVCRFPYLDDHVSRIGCDDLKGISDFPLGHFCRLLRESLRTCRDCLKITGHILVPPPLTCNKHATSRVTNVLPEIFNAG